MEKGLLCVRWVRKSRGEGVLRHGGFLLIGRHHLLDFCDRFAGVETLKLNLQED